jgi:type I restriction enzyme S subunit
MTDVNKLIIDNIDVWTCAIKKRNATGRGSNKKIELTGVKKLRELILELAVRGKLVAQDVNDEPASVLLETIAKEKEQLIADKKVKRTKSLPEITDEDKTFELPDGWEWCSNLALFSLTKGKKPKNLSEKNIGFPYLDIEALDRNNTLRFTDDEKCPMSTSKDLIVVCDGSRSGLVLDGKDGVIGSTLAIINTPRYIQTFIKLFFQQAFQRLNSSMKGAAIPHLDTKALREGYLAFPPLAEQHRIVAKVDELMALCDQLEQQTEQSLTAQQTLVEVLLAALTNCDSADDFQTSWQRIAEHFDVLFTTELSIEQLKKTILQLAVMGKLVPQNPSDEPASVLLEKIAEEKVQLIADKKIKIQKPLPAITDEEKPFELPNGWEYSRFASYSNEIATGPFGTMIHKRDYVESGVPLINPSHMINSAIQEDKTITVTKIKANDLSSYKLFENDIVMARRGEMGRCALVTKREEGWLCGTGSFVLRFNNDLSRAYILLLFKTQYVKNYLGGKSIGTTMTNLNHGILNKMPMLIPPLAEQHRIITEVDRLMALCEQLKTRLSDAQTTQLHLADAVVENALGDAL